MSSRGRRAALRAEHEAPPWAFDRAEALARWRQKLTSMTGRGFASPPFASFILGPIVDVDRPLREPTETEIVCLSYGTKPS